LRSSRHISPIAGTADHGAVLHLMFQDSPLPMFVYDRDSLAILDANAAAAELYGYSLAEFTRMRLTDIRPPDDVAAFIEHMRAQRDAARSRGEWRHRRSDGSEIDTVVIQHILELDGRRAGLAVVQDVSGHRRAEASARDAEAFLEQVLQQLSAVVFVIDLDGRFTLVNPAVAEITGYRPDELADRPFTCLFDDDVLPEVNRQFARVARGGETVLEFVTRLRRKDGGSRVIRMSGAPLRRDGRIAGAVGIAEDVTERRALEQRVTHLQRARDAASACNRAVVRAQTEAGLLAEICRTLVETGGYRLAWVGYAEADADKTLRRMASFGAGEAYLDGLKVTWGEDAHGGGPGGKAIRSGRPSLAGDLWSDPDFAPWRETARRHGLRSCVSLPLLADGRAFGVLILYATEPQAIDADELALLVELADDLASGIRGLRADAALARRTRDLDERIKELRCLYAVSRIVQDHSNGRAADDAVFQELVDTLPPAFAFPELTAAHFVLNGREYRTARYADTPWRLAVPVRVAGREAGELAVVCLEALPSADLGPFLKEERELLEAVAEQIGKLVERREAHEALRREQDLRERLTDTSPAGIVLLDRHGHIQFANARAEQVLGLERDAITARHYNDPQWHVTDWLGNPLPEGQLPFAQVMRGGGPVYGVEHAIEWPDGGRILLSINAAPLLDADGGLDGVVATVEDVTARQQAEDERERLVRHNEMILKAAGEGIYGRDLEGRITFVNPAAARMLGYAPEDLIGVSMHECTHHSHVDGTPFPRAQCSVEATLRDGESRMVGGEVYWRKDGSQFPVEYVSAPIVQGDKITGAVVVFRDVSEQRRQQDLLAGEKRILELIARNRPLPEVLDDLAGMFESQCRLGVRCGLFLLAPESGSLHAVAGPSLPEDYRRELDGMVLGGAGVLAIRAGLLNDIGEEPAWAPFRALAGCYDLSVRWVVPITGVLGRAQGLLVLYDPHPQCPAAPDRELIDRIARLAGIAIEKHQAEDRLTTMAFYDALTGLPNRVLLHDRLHQAMIEAARHERLVAVMFLDLDRFKTINDSLGHETGDQLLKVVAERLLGCLRPGDTASRLGGDEFTLLLADVAHVDDVARIAQKIIDSFVQPFDIAGYELFVTTSIGITLFPFDDRDVELLLKNADTAMYYAKEEGRNTFQFYSAEMNVKSVKRLTLETALRRALERDEFRLHYQPQVSLVTGELTGVEALLRWQHPELGLVSPGEFIPLAEETGLIVPIGEWALHAACAQARAWQDAGIPALRVAVNLSPRQFRHKDLGRVVARVLRETGLDARLLELELTESLLMRDVEQTIAVLNGLKRMGVSISIDDFGTGYSSLSYLRRFPIDTLKIDRSFIEHIADHADGTAIAQTIIVLAHNLKMNVVAEGVEQPAQLRFLSDQGCDAMQGYYFSKPLPADELTPRLLAGWRLRLDEVA